MSGCGKFLEEFLIPVAYRLIEFLCGGSHVPDEGVSLLYIEIIISEDSAEHLQSYGADGPQGVFHAP